MGLPRSSSYYKPKTRSLKQLKKEADLRDLIEAIVLEFPLYGYRRVTKALHRHGLRGNHKSCLALCEKMNFCAVPG